MAQVFFPQRPATHPMIYAYEDTNPQYRGLLKVGYTTVDVDRRVAQQYPTKRPDGSVPYRIVLRESAMYPDGSCFNDHDVHRVLERKGVQRVGGEWFRCTVPDVQAAIVAVRNHTDNVENRTQTFAMRPEQAEAVNRTIAYYRSAYEEGSNRTPKFLWNAKMRFGKTFAAYELAKKMGFKRVLILTFKPAVQTAWREDLMTHVDFEGWQFISRDANNLQDTINDQYQRAKTGPSSVLVPSRIFSASTKRPAASRPTMNGYIPPTGTWSSLTSTTLVPGKKTPVSCLSRTRTATTRT